MQAPQLPQIKQTPLGTAISYKISLLLVVKSSEPASLAPSWSVEEGLRLWGGSASIGPSPREPGEDPRFQFRNLPQIKKCWRIWRVFIHNKFRIVSHNSTKTTLHHMLSLLFWIEYLFYSFLFGILCFAMNMIQLLLKRIPSLVGPLFRTCHVLAELDHLRHLLRVLLQHLIRRMGMKHSGLCINKKGRWEEKGDCVRYQLAKVMKKANWKQHEEGY